ncbi:hypothetical protein LSCM1_01516 [Leishmania martiniquensis]|uniref:Uncharacterized protein n=1 Tax=Leishmania martiniquensis TaxID=1580590 RepID=A0A836KMP8_9TRYP|nr:hypothetical protein LSCM1_01516 [Leishmania martiniquensis]
MSSDYVYDDSADLTSPLCSLVRSVGGNSWAAGSGPPTASVDDFQIPTAQSSLQSHSQYDLPLTGAIDVPPREAHVCPRPPSPLVALHAAVDETRQRASVRASAQSPTGGWRCGGIDSAKPNCKAALSPMLKDPSGRVLGHSADGGLFGPRSLFTTANDDCASSIRIGMADKEMCRSMGWRPSASVAFQDSVKVSRRAPLEKAPVSPLPVADAGADTSVRTDGQVYHRSTLSDAWINSERSLFSPSSARLSGLRAPPSLPSIPCVHGAGDLRAHSKHRSLHCSGSGTSRLSLGRQQRAASESSPTMLQEEDYFFPCGTPQPSIQPAYTSARGPEVGSTESSGCDDRDEEEADGSPLGHRPAYDLSCVTGAVEDAAEAEIDPLDYDTGALDSGDDVYGDLVNLPREEAEPLLLRWLGSPSIEQPWRAATNRHPKSAMAPPTVMPPAPTLQHAPSTREEVLSTWEPVRTKTSSTAENRKAAPSFRNGTNTKRPDEKVSNKLFASCAMKPLRPTHLVTSLSPPRLITTRAPHPTSPLAGSESALGAAVTAEAQRLSTPQQATEAAALNGEGAATGTTRSRCLPKTSTVLNRAGEGGTQAIVTLNGSTTSSETSLSGASKAVASSSATPSPTVSKSDSTQSMHVSSLRGEPLTPLRKPHSRVHVLTGSSEIDHGPIMSRKPWPLQSPASSIIVRHRLFDPKHPRPHGPRTRRLLNGRRRANWEAPETHYATTLADLAAYEEDEDDVQERHVAGASDGGKVIGVSVSAPRLTETQGSPSSPRSTAAETRGRGRVTVPTRSPASPSTAPHVSPLQPPTSSLSPKTSAVSMAKTTVKSGSAPILFGPLAAAASAEADAGGMQDSLNTSTNVARRTGGIVVDEVEKALRLREESECLPGLDALQIQPSSLPPHIHRAPTITRSVKSPLPSKWRRQNHLNSPTARGEGVHMCTSSSGSGSSSCTTRDSGVAEGFNVLGRQQLASYSTTGIRSLIGDSFGLSARPRSPKLPTFARIIAQHCNSSAADVEESTSGAAKRLSESDIPTSFADHKFSDTLPRAGSWLTRRGKTE